MCFCLQNILLPSAITEKHVKRIKYVKIEAELPIETCEEVLQLISW